MSAERLAFLYDLLGLPQAGECEVSSRGGARNVERSELTGWGAVWTVVFIIATVVSFLGGAAATTVFQQIEASLVALILFGLAFTTLRRRTTFTIYRSGGA